MSELDETLNRPLPKRGRVRLPAKAFDTLRQRVLQRDGWRCQNCGRAENLQVHHLEARSQLGSDTMENLITLCADCHRRVHRC